MKSLRLLLVVFVSVFAVVGAEAGEKKAGGPNGGRVIRTVEPNLEFLVTGERKVEIRALKEGKPVALGEQVISVTAGDRSKPTKLELQLVEGRLVSSNALPAGDDFPVSVSVKTTPAAKAVYEKFQLEMAKCPTCQYSEYACVCEHAGEKK